MGQRFHFEEYLNNYDECKELNKTIWNERIDPNPQSLL